MSVPCFLPTPEDYPDRDTPPEEYGDEWRSESGQCDHIDCIQANQVRRLYQWANPRREVVLEDHGAYVVTAELAP